MKLPLNSINYTKGLYGTMVRHIARGMSLYVMYFLWFERESKMEVTEYFEKK